MPDDNEGSSEMRLIQTVLLAFFAVLTLVAAAGFVLYLQDYKLEAHVQDTRCERSEVEIKTKQFGIVHTVTEVPLNECLVLQVGSFVEYRIRSQRTTLYLSEGGDCVYDSQTTRC